MENKKIKLTQDRGSISWCKRTVEMEEESLYYELKRFFKRRKGDFKERFFKLGTHDYDKFIVRLIGLGYREI